MFVVEAEDSRLILAEKSTDITRKVNNEFYKHTIHHRIPDIHLLDRSIGLCHRGTWNPKQHRPVHRQSYSAAQTASPRKKSVSFSVHKLSPTTNESVSSH